MTFTINVHTPKSPLLTSPAPLVGPGSLDPSLLGTTCLSQFPSTEGLVKRKLAPQVHSGFCYKTRSLSLKASLSPGPAASTSPAGRRIRPWARAPPRRPRSSGATARRPGLATRNAPPLSRVGALPVRRRSPGRPANSGTRPPHGPQAQSPGASEAVTRCWLCGRAAGPRAYLDRGRQCRDEGGAGRRRREGRGLERGRREDDSRDDARNGARSPAAAAH